LDCWGLSFVIFFDAVILISWSGSQVWDVSSSWHRSSFFMSFLVDFFPQFHHSILGWSRIRLHSFYRFTFYEMIMISLPGSRVWRVSPDWFRSFFFLFNFILQHWLRLLWSHYPGCGFSCLTQVFLSFFCRIFPNLFLQHLIYLKLGFIFFFRWFFVRSAQSHYLGHGFGRLAQFESAHFFVFF